MINDTALAYFIFLELEANANSNTKNSINLVIYFEIKEFLFFTM